MPELYCIILNIMLYIDIMKILIIQTKRVGDIIIATTCTKGYKKEALSIL